MTNTYYREILERSRQGPLSRQEADEVASELQKRDPNIPRITLLHILSQMRDLTYLGLVEQFLYSEEDPMLTRLALKILCAEWGLTPRYVDQVLIFMRPVPWDEAGYIRQLAISIAGEYLRRHQNAPLLQELARIFADAKPGDIILEDTYFALARAVGREWSQIPSAAHPIDVATQVDPEVITMAKQRLQHGG